MSHPDTNEFYQGMTASIILNLCKNPLYGDYPWHDDCRRLDVSLKKIITKTILQLQLLIHITKMNPEPTESAHYIKIFEPMVEYEPVEDLSKSWLELAKKTMSNESVLSSIDGLIDNVFEVEINDSNKRTIGASFVDLTDTDLRGFSGFDWIYINFAHFDVKRDIDSILNDINMATPTKVPRQCTIEDLDFGRITERNFFGAAPDWLKSLNGGTDSEERLLHFAETFISAIQTNKKVPALPLGLKLENRGGITTMEADIEI